jgi:hypothetical protein
LVVDWDLVVVEKVDLRVSDTDIVADPAQPKDGPLGPCVEHLRDVDGDQPAHQNYKL